MLSFYSLKSGKFTKVSSRTVKVDLMAFLSMKGVYTTCIVLGITAFVCCFFYIIFRETFKSAGNSEVVKRLVNEVRMLNPEFQAGHIRCKQFL